MMYVRNRIHAYHIDMWSPGGKFPLPVTEG